MKRTNKITKLIIAACALVVLTSGGCSKIVSSKEAAETEVSYTIMEETGKMELSYATQFQVTYYGENALVEIGDYRYFLVPKEANLPTDIPTDVTLIRTPVENMYLASSSCMDLYRGIDALSSIRYTGTKESEWYVEEAKEAMSNGSIVYAGKYSAPDYEMLLAGGCELAIENTMIFHNPEVKEQLENLGIPVLVEYSSYENNPLGRMEWIKLHGLLAGKEEEAEAYFSQQTSKVDSLKTDEPTDKTVAFFYITSNGAVNVRTSDDYVAEMIRMAGGNYIFPDLDAGESAKSTVNLQMEKFYAQAKDADILVYNATIGDEPETLADLLAKSALLSDFKAVKNGNVWCAKKNMFQQTTGVGDMILDFYQVIHKTGSEPTYLKKLQ